MNLVHAKQELRDVLTCFGLANTAPCDAASIHVPAVHARTRLRCATYSPLKAEWSVESKHPVLGRNKTTCLTNKYSNAQQESNGTRDFFLLGSSISLHQGPGCRRPGTTICFGADSLGHMPQGPATIVRAASRDGHLDGRFLSFPMGWTSSSGGSHKGQCRSLVIGFPSQATPKQLHLRSHSTDTEMLNQHSRCIYSSLLHFEQSSTKRSLR